MPTQDTTTSPSGLDVNKILSELEVPFPPDQVQWRVTSTTNDKRRGQVVPYADPRAYTDRLNALLSPQGWTSPRSATSGGEGDPNSVQQRRRQLFLPALS